MRRNLPRLRPIRGGVGLSQPAALDHYPLVIENPWFQAPYIEQAEVKELKVADHWRVRWEPGVGSPGILVRPECYPKNLGPIWNPTAEQCQGIQSTYATHNAAFVQIVNCPLGATGIRVEAQVAYYAPGSGAAVTMGLDPTGQATDIRDGAIVWSDHWLDQDNGWDPETWGTLAHTVPYSVYGQVGIWLRSCNRWRARNTHFWWRHVIGRYVTDTVPGDCQPNLEAILGKCNQILGRLEGFAHLLAGASQAMAMFGASRSKEGIDG